MSSAQENIACKNSCPFRAITDIGNCKMVHRDVEEMRETIKEMQDLLHRLDKSILRVVVISSLTSTLVCSALVAVFSKALGHVL